MTPSSGAIGAALAKALPAVEIAAPGRAELSDATEAHGLLGHADALALPRDAEEVAAVLAWCYEHDVALTPRGGGTGFAGGAVPLRGGVVLDLRHMNRVRSFDPPLWRAEVEAGVRTAEVHRLARENGLSFPPDPGAAEQSQIGGNIATNAGGPHTFKYGATGAWVTGLEVVLAPGDVVRLGGAVRKDVAGYDLRSLLVGSEGTLGIVTAAWLRLIPAPERSYPVLALYPDARAGTAAVRAILEAGIEASAIEYLDNATMALAGGACPADVVTARDAAGAFAVLAEVDGGEEEALRARGELLEALGEARVTYAPSVPQEIGALWRWRAGIPYAVQAKRGGKLSEDIVVPLDRLQEAIEGTLQIASRHDLVACSWGHAGDGNLHATMLLDPSDRAEVARAESAARDLFELAVELGGSISGEHGLGTVKSGHLGVQWDTRALALHEGIKRLFDPKGLLNPGTKSARQEA
ncbi:MAG TPA: FAD-linked oxidase C-terminal domain-containing protein [Solirubrobacteraceae bacterium]